MNLLTMILLGFGLSLDAFAVSVANGIIIRERRVYHSMRFGFWFGFSQMIMPVLGWLAGIKLQRFLMNIDHWIAFLLLSAIGLKMIYEALKLESIEKNVSVPSARILFVLAVATSIDALVVGLSFAMLNVSVIVPSLVIGVVTFCMAYAGVSLGNRFGHMFEKRIEILGGVVLIGIGLKILFDHIGS